MDGKIELAAIDGPAETDPLKEEYLHNNNSNKRRKCQNIWYDVKKNITIEPSVLLFSITYMMTSISTQNLSLEKACRVDLNLTDKICTALRRQEIKEQNEYEVETHKLLASALSWKTYLTATIPALMTLFVGTWLDKTGRRKIFLVVGIIGHILMPISDLIQTFFFNELGIIFLTFSEAIFYCLGGGSCIFVLSSMSYVSFITNKETRTFRIGVIHFCSHVGYPIGASLSGILLKKFGYYGSYGFIILLHTINLLYLTIFVKDTKRNAEHKEHDNKCGWHILRTFFDFSIIKQLTSVIIKKRSNNRKLCVVLLLCVVIVTYGPFNSLYTFLYMMTRYRFNWEELQFSLFQTYNILVHTIGLISSLTLFSKIWKWNDSLLGILSGISKIAGSVLFCFAPNGSIFYIGTLLDMLSGLGHLISKSIMSKIVNPDEIGKALSLITLIENLSPLVFVPLYSKLYIATMKVLPGALFLVVVIMILPAIAVFSWILYEDKKALRTPAIRNEVEIPSNSKQLNFFVKW